MMSNCSNVTIHQMILAELQDEQPFNLLQETEIAKIAKTHPNKANLYL